ncbi:hypothetical protein [Legionella fallonii]|uniref:Uncharacterized protein n=1 Tax=Legionella fallonii LLAP-10 TaxID=1212491 RepID=A0A098G1M5_9GAMM|nr:hypothetical protein [Legionella fallonii]CEG56388.1 conserved protein of unknown function [Legionella fallonii LLAP-10]
MKEKHFAYKITHDSSGLVCTYSEIEEDKMLDLLKEIQNNYSEGIFWIFKQFDVQPKEPLCIIDCTTKRIYYHYSGDVEDLKDTINKLTH